MTQNFNSLHQAIGNAFYDAKRRVLRASRQGTDLRETITHQTSNLKRRLLEIADGLPEPQSAATPAAHAAISLVTSAVDRELVALAERVHAGGSPVDSYRQFESAIHSEVPATCFLGYEAAHADEETYTRSDLNAMQIERIVEIASGLGIKTGNLDKNGLIDEIQTRYALFDHVSRVEKGGA